MSVHKCKVIDCDEEGTISHHFEGQPHFLLCPKHNCDIVNGIKLNLEEKELPSTIEEEEEQRIQDEMKKALEVDYYDALKQVLIKEQLQSKTQPAKLDPEFYKNVNEYKKHQPPEIQDSMTEIMMALYRKRNTKIIQYAVSSNINDDYSGKFTAEEYAFFKEIQHANKKLKAEMRI